jgi:chemotaxis protein methyltransferase CheR
MDQGLFQRFCELAYDKAGIRLKAGKEALVSARVAKRQRALGVPDLQDYLVYLESDESGDEVVHFLDAISTNYTRFFREQEHFDFLAAQVKGWAAQGRRRLRIWSAASSSGEEPYSIAICLAEAIGHLEVDFRVLATDISTRKLAEASAGVYTAEAVAALDSPTLCRYFERRRDRKSGATTYTVRPWLRERVVFKRLNLSTPPFPMLGPLDVVFCRNVMIYFDRDVRQRLVSEISRLLGDQCYLLTGHAETLTGLCHDLKVIKPSIYRKTHTKEKSAPPEASLGDVR